MKRLTGKIQIKSRKDWIIAFVLAFLLIYLIVLRYRVTINDWLLPLQPDKVGYFNQPENHGVYAVTVLCVTALAIGVMIYKRIKGKYVALALAGGLLTVAVIAGTYAYHCHQLLKIPFESQPESMWVTGDDWEKDAHLRYELDEATEKLIADKVRSLERLPKEEEQKQRDAVLAGMKKDNRGKELSISLWYGRKNRAPYHIWVNVENGMIYINKGHGIGDDPFFRDNGLLEILENLKTE